MNSLKNDLRTHLYFLKMISINLFCKEKAFILMSTWMYGKSLNETPFPEKEEFYSNLSMENIKGTDYTDAKRICKDFMNIMSSILKVIN